MFIIDRIKFEESTGKLKILLYQIKKTLGFIPLHLELLGTISVDRLREFVQKQIYWQNHPKINYDLLPFLRLYIANKENRTYCIDFNTELLTKKGIDNSMLNLIANNIRQIPFEQKDKLLAVKTIKAIYEPNEFCRNDLQELYEFGYSDNDIYDIIEYCSWFIGLSRIIEIYKDKK